MKKIILLGLLLSLISCRQGKTEHVVEVARIDSGLQIDGKSMVIYVIDSCEYIGGEYIYSDSSLLTHKGNCKFCIERNKKK